MKKINIASALAFVLAGGMTLSSCTSDFEKLNTNQTEVNPSDLPFSAQASEPMNYCYPPQENMFQFWTNLTIDFYGGYFMTPNGNFTNGDMGENRGHSGGMYEDFYLHIFNNTRRIIADCYAKQQEGLAGVMRVVQAFGLMMCTDAYGPLAYSSIISGESETSYAFDSQQKLYEQMIDELKKAETGIKAMTADEKTTLGTFDVWCGGNTDRWIQVINTMKLRIALRLSKRVSEMAADGYDLKALAKEAATNTLAVSNQDVLIDNSMNNEMAKMINNWGDCGFNANLVTLMTGFKDPRLPLFMTKNVGAITDSKTGAVTPAWSGYYGIRFASGLPPKPNYTANFSQWIYADMINQKWNGVNTMSAYSMARPIFKAAESYFLLAEAQLRGWISTGRTLKDLYETGIRVAMSNELAYRGKWCGTTSYADGAVDAYINGTTPQSDFVDPGNSELNHKAMNHLGVKWDDNATNEEKLERIITQKFLANFPLSNESWAEYRRTGYPRFFPPYVNESNGAVNSEEGVRRSIYSSNAYNSNDKGVQGGVELLNKENTAKTGISGDKGGTHLWWDNANKGNFD